MIDESKSTVTVADQPTNLRPSLMEQTPSDPIPMNGEKTTSPGLHAALVEAFGGTRRFQWSDKAFRRFGLYLEARRAVVEWARYEAGVEEVLAALDAIAEQRGVTLALTAKGRKAWTRAMDFIELRNQEIFGSLSPQEREQLHEAADQATRVQRQLAAGEDERAMERLADLGVQVVPAGQIDLEEFRASVQGVSAAVVRDLPGPLVQAFRLS